MRNETKIWLEYAHENLQSANILLESKLYNPCLQNIQQSVEKALKAVFIENAIPFLKTHNIMRLKNVLLESDIEVELSDDECDFQDTIYLPSKYPVASIIPNFYPDKTLCELHLSAAEDFL